MKGRCHYEIRTRKGDGTMIGDEFDITDGDFYDRLDGTFDDLVEKEGEQ